MKALFFDLDNTLYPADPVYGSGLRRAWKSAVAGDGVTPEFRDMGYPAFKDAYDAARKQVKQLIPGHTSVHSRLLYFKRLLENLTGSCRPALCLALDDAYSSAWEEIHDPETAALLGRLAERGPLGIITNHVCSTQMQKLSRLDPSGSLFKWVVTSEEAGVEKPDPRIFREALRRAGCEAGAACMVGDDWEADIEGAAAVGMPAIYVSESSPPREPDGRTLHWIRSLGELERLAL